MLDVIELTRRLVRFETVNPPGHERDCARYVAELLVPLGFQVTLHEFAEQRTTLVAEIAGSGAPVCFTGHFDVVPLGAAPWSVEPFAGEVANGRLYGRGSADMKGGLAAMMVAAERWLPHRRSNAPGLLLVFTAGEETFGDGARQLAQAAVLPRAAALVVGEPTGNVPFVAHKGCARFRLRTHGITAHASTPERGDNAIFKAAEAVLQLRALELGVPAHPVLGRPTLNVGTIAGGMNLNSVPDAATIGVDIRTIAGQDAESVAALLRQAVGEEVEITTLEAGEGIATDPDDPFIVRVFATVAAVTGMRPDAAAAPYFTDAAFLKPALASPPTVILGPGEVAQAHVTDEYCELAKLEQAVEIYRRILADGEGGV